jgi:hypothetical protein
LLRQHQLPNRIEHRLELLVVSPFQIGQLPCEILVGGQDLT